MLVSIRLILISEVSNQSSTIKISEAGRKSMDHLTLMLHFENDFAGVEPVELSWLRFARG